jgi:O-antigen ligase
MTDAWRHESSDMRPRRDLAWWRRYIPSAHPVEQVIDGALLLFAVFAVVSITVSQAAILTALGAWLAAFWLLQEERPLRLPLLWPMGALLLASMLATATAVDPARSLRELRNVFQPAFFFLLVNHLRQEDRAIELLRVLLVVGSLMAVYGLSQSVVRGEAFRIRGTMSIWMTYAGLMMVLAMMTLALCLFASDRRAWWRGSGALLLQVGALLMTHTRGAWLGCAAGAALLFACRKRLFLLLLPLLLLALFIAAPHAVQQRMRSIVDPQDATAKERLYMWQSGVQMLRDRPWTGVGLDNVKVVYPAYRDPRASGARWGHLHNNVIQVAVERGLVGLACWAWLWVAFYRQAQQIYRRLGAQAGQAKALVLGSIAAVTAFHIEGLFEYTFGDSEVVTLVYFLMALPYVVAGTTASKPA